MGWGGRWGGGGRKKINEKSSENDQLTGQFQSFFLSPEKTVKLVR